MKTYLSLLVGLVGIVGLNPSLHAQSLDYGRQFSYPRDNAYASVGRKVIVSRVQVAMERYGYYVGLNTGEFGFETRRAIRRFRIVNNLPVNGKIDQVLLDALGVR